LTKGRPNTNTNNNNNNNNKAKCIPGGTLRVLAGKNRLWLLPLPTFFKTCFYFI
jgi:hypothetical protein